MNLTLSPDVIQNLMTQLNNALAKLGVTTDYAFKIYVKQQTVFGITMSVLLAALMLLTFVTFIVIIWRWIEYPGNKIAVVVTLLIIELVLGLILALMIRYFMNPEYYAIQNILSQVQNLLHSR